MMKMTQEQVGQSAHFLDMEIVQDVTGNTCIFSEIL
ncbi:unnamed protein product [Ectocarpus sp. CCAP 1310/34]|nr:unnamed protein product [Ectocarpus sp. CCAP 1310/34]